jgi:hypothetical protein
MQPKLTREEKALEMFSKGVIVRRTQDGYEVPGSNGSVYDITETEDGCLFCTCPDALYRSHQGEMCKHSLLVEMVRPCLPTKGTPVINHDIHLKRERVVV